MKRRARYWRENPWAHKPRSPATTTCHNCGRRFVQGERIRVKLDPEKVRRTYWPWRGRQPGKGSVKKVMETIREGSWWGSPLCGDCRALKYQRLQIHNHHQVHPRRERRGPSMGRRA